MQLPKTLYKYCPADRKDVLEGKRIRFTQADDLNDLFEMKPVAVATSRAAWASALATVARLNPDGPIHDCSQPPSAAEKHKRLTETLKDVLVLCLSSAWDNIPMWAYYAGENKGFVVGFNAESNFLTDLKPVGYASRPTFYGPGNFGSTIYTKGQHWKHEKEWRAVRNLGKDTPVSTLTPDAVFPIHLFAFEPKDITEVTLGHRMSMEVRSALLRILHQPEYNHVTVWQADPSNERFALQRRQLTRKPDLHRRLAEVSHEWDQFIREQ